MANPIKIVVGTSKYCRAIFMEFCELVTVAAVSSSDIGAFACSLGPSFSGWGQSVLLTRVAGSDDRSTMALLMGMRYCGLLGNAYGRQMGGLRWQRQGSRAKDKSVLLIGHL